MKKLSMILAAGLLFGFAGSAYAAQNYVIHISYPTGAADVVPEGWFYRVTSYDPVNASDCLQNGTAAPAGNTDIKVISNYGPPFYGSASKKVYLTVCFNGGGANEVPVGSYITIFMEIEYSSCISWVCTTRWAYSILRQTPNNAYFVTDDTIWPDFLQIYVEWLYG